MTKFIQANIPVAYLDGNGHGIEDDTAAAAAYLSWIAYPRPDQAQRATRFVNAVRVIPYKKARRHPPGDIQGIDSDKIDGTIRDAINSVGRRWPAQWMALKIMGMDGRWPDGLSAARAATLVCDPDGTINDDEGALNEDGEPKKVAERVWRDSLPALAMLFALPPPRDRKIEWLQQPEWLPEAVSFAAEIAPEIAKRFDAKVMFIPRLIAV